MYSYGLLKLKALWYNNSDLFAGKDDPIMTRDEETYFIRLMQAADEDTLNKHFHLTDTIEYEDGAVELRFDVSYGQDRGGMFIKFIPEPRELLMSEMNVGFQTMIGLNRSPLELRILCDHLLDVLYYKQ